MKKLFFKAVVFVSLVLILSNFIQYLAPYDWANKGFSAKVRYLEESSEQFNTFFFGSSRMYRHIDPITFDELASPEIKSYNLGFSSTFVPETYYLIENFLKNTRPIEQGYILVELQVIYPIPEVNLHTTDVQYFLTPKEYLFAVRATLQNPFFTTRRKLTIITNYTITFLEKLTGIGLMSDLFTTVTHDFPAPDLSGDYGLENRGLLSLEAEIRAKQTKGLIERNQEFLKDPSELISREKQARTLYQQKSSLGYSMIHLQRINRLIELAEKKGYHLIVILQPKLPPNNNLELLPLLREIDDQHKIDLADPNRFPEFYLVENSFDIGHFNEVGIDIFTRKLAEEFNKLLKNDPAYSEIMNSD